jgi:hypothetical protein
MFWKTELIVCLLDFESFSHSEVKFNYFNKLQNSHLQSSKKRRKKKIVMSNGSIVIML